MADYESKLISKKTAKQQLKKSEEFINRIKMDIIMLVMPTYSMDDATLWPHVELSMQDSELFEEALT